MCNTSHLVYSSIWHFPHTIPGSLDPSIGLPTTTTTTPFTSSWFSFSSMKEQRIMPYSTIRVTWNKVQGKVSYLLPQRTRPKASTEAVLGIHALVVWIILIWIQIFHVNIQFGIQRECTIEIDCLDINLKHWMHTNCNTWCKHLYSVSNPFQILGNLSK